MYRVSHAQGAGFGFVDEVLAEIHFRGVGGVATIASQGAEGFWPAFGGELVGGGHDAARARTGGAEDDFTGAPAAGTIFGVGRAIAEDEAGTKTIHRHGGCATRGQSLVEVGERGFADGHQGKGIGKHDHVARARV